VILLKRDLSLVDIRDYRRCGNENKWLISWRFKDKRQRIRTAIDRCCSRTDYREILRLKPE
jgi:hypothetical protein